MTKQRNVTEGLSQEHITDVILKIPLFQPSVIVVGCDYFPAPQSLPTISAFPSTTQPQIQNLNVPLVCMVVYQEISMRGAFGLVDVQGMFDNVQGQP